MSSPTACSEQPQAMGSDWVAQGYSLWGTKILQGERYYHLPRTGPTGVKRFSLESRLNLYSFSWCSCSSLSRQIPLCWACPHLPSPLHRGTEVSVAAAKPQFSGSMWSFSPTGLFLSLSAHICAYPVVGTFYLWYPSWGWSLLLPCTLCFPSKLLCDFSCSSSSDLLTCQLL